MAAGTGPPTYAIRVWEVQTGKEVQALLGHEGHVSSLAFSPCIRIWPGIPLLSSSG